MAAFEALSPVVPLRFVERQTAPVKLLGEVEPTLLPRDERLHMQGERGTGHVPRLCRE